MSNKETEIIEKFYSYKNQKEKKLFERKQFLRKINRILLMLLGLLLVILIVLIILYYTSVDKEVTEYSRKIGSAQNIIVEKGLETEFTNYRNFKNISLLQSV